MLFPASADYFVLFILSCIAPRSASDCGESLENTIVVSASQIVRQITIPNAFVVGYEEDFTDENGAGTFRLLIKQKKDKMSNLKFEGGFGEE